MTTITSAMITKEFEKLYIYHARNVTPEQIEACKLQLCDDWQNLPVELIEVKQIKKDIVYASTIPMKMRGLNLINKK